MNVLELTILEGDCLDVLAGLPADSVNLIITSPPYAQRRKDTYGGIDPANYTDWFIPRAEQMKRVLKPDGTFILNIWEHCENGERHTYVLELVLAMKAAGWKWIEEYIWRKINPIPGFHKLRLRDAWEHLYHFSKTTNIAIYHDAVAQPAKWEPSDKTKFVGDKSGNGSRISTGPRVRRVRNNGSNFGTTDSNFGAMVVAHNVIETTIGGGAREHPGTFPRALPEFFINLFTVPGDTVLDPFVGSGTTLFTACEMDRHSIGIEIHPEYVEKIKNQRSKLTKRLGLF